MIKLIISYEVVMLVILVVSLVTFSLTGEVTHRKIAQASFSGLLSPLVIVFLIFMLLLVAFFVLLTPIILPVSILLDKNNEL